jgi:hypothetical protein
VGPFFGSPPSIEVRPTGFDNVFIARSISRHIVQQGMQVMDRRDANVWCIPIKEERSKTLVFLIQPGLNKLDHPPQ